MIYSRINTLGRQMICRRPASTLLALALMIVSTDPQTIVAQVGDKAAQEVPSLIEIPTASGEAYVEYLRGLELRDAQTVSVASPNYDSDGISEHFLRATELDPAFLDAWLMIVQFSSGAVWFNRDPDGRHLQHVQDALARIQELAPDSPEKDLANGFYEYYVTRDITAAFTAFESAAAGRPNNLQALEYLSASARRLQLWDTSASAMDRLVLLDPDDQRARRQQINNLQDSTDYDATIEATAKAIQKFPDDVWFRVRHAALVARHTGDVTLCRQLMDDIPPKDLMQNGFRSTAMLRGVFADPNEAVAWIEAADPDARSHETAPQYVNYVNGILLLVGGDTKGAQLRFKAAYARFSARLDAADESYRRSRVGWLSVLAALAGEEEVAREYRELALNFADTTDDVLYGNTSRWNAAFTLAVLGDVDEAWLELEPLIGEPRGSTEWDLVVYYDTSYFLADSKGYQARVAQLKDSVNGPWKIVETWGHNPEQGEWRTQNIQPSLFLFMDGYYSITFVRGEKNRPLMLEDATREGLTAEEAASVWIPFVSNAGTYEITTTEITTHPIAALWPNFMEGASRVYTYSVKGRTIQLFSSGEDWSWNLKLQRLP